MAKEPAFIWSAPDPAREQELDAAAALASAAIATDLEVGFTLFAVDLLLFDFACLLVFLPPGVVDLLSAVVEYSFVA